MLDAIAIDGAGNRTPLAARDARGWCSPSDEARSPSSLSALLAAGCGFGAGDESGGSVTVTVSQDFGETRGSRRRSRETAREGETVMRLLQRSFDVKTRFGGNFVQEIDGVSGGREDGRARRLVLLRQRDRVLRGRRRAQAVPGRPRVVGPPRLGGRDARPGRRRLLPGAVPVAAPAARSCRSGSSASARRTARATRSRRGCATPACATSPARTSSPRPARSLRILVGRWSRRPPGHRRPPARGGPGGLRRLRQAGRGREPDRVDRRRRRVRAHARRRLGPRRGDALPRSSRRPG